MEPRQPINASIARRIGSGSVGQAFMTLTKFGSEVSNPVSAESGHSQFPVVFWESGQVGNLPHEGALRENLNFREVVSIFEHIAFDDSALAAQNQCRSFIRGIDTPFARPVHFFGRLLFLVAAKLPAGIANSQNCEKTWPGLRPQPTTEETKNQPNDSKYDDAQNNSQCPLCLCGSIRGP